VPTPILNKANDIQCTYVESGGMQLDDGRSKSPLGETNGSRVRIVKIVSFDVNREDGGDSFKESSTSRIHDHFGRILA
jgi:hypothetical protein